MPPKPFRPRRRAVGRATAYNVATLGLATPLRSVVDRLASRSQVFDAEVQGALV